MGNGSFPVFHGKHCGSHEPEGSEGRSSLEGVLLIVDLGKERVR